MSAEGKPLETILKLEIEAGKANPAPPIGPALGQHGVNIKEFCDAYNNATKDKSGTIPVEISIFKDKSFALKLKTPPVSGLIRKALNIKSGSDRPNVKIVGKLTREQLEEIAQLKMPDLNAADLEGACKIIEGSARSMGVRIK